LFRSLVAAFGVAFIVVVVTVGVSERTSERAAAEMQRVFADELEVTEASRTALRSIIELETSERSFLLTGEEKPLDRYREGRRSLPAQLAALRTRVGKDPEELALVDGLGAKVERWYAEATPEIEARRNSAPGPMSSEVAVMLSHLTGKQMVDSARETGRLLRARASTLRRQAEQSVEVERVHARHVIVVTTIGAGMFVFFIGVRLTRRLEHSVRWLVTVADRIGAGDYAVAKPTIELESMSRVSQALLDSAQSLAQRELEAQTLLSVSREIGGARSSPDLAKRLYASLQPIIPVAQIAVAVIESIQVRLLALAPLPKNGMPNPPYRVPAESSIMKQLCSSRRPVVVHDIAARVYEEDAMAAGFGLSAYAHVPIFSGDTVTGAIVIGLAQGGFSDRQVLFLETLGQQIARQIESTELRDLLERRNEELEQATRAKSEFLAMMSHELRTPLNAIIGFSELLADMKLGQLSPMQTRFVRNVVDSGRHLLGLINELLDLSKIEAGKLSVTCQSFAPRPLTVQAVAALQPLAESRHVKVSVNDAPVSAMYADPVRYTQVLYNFLSNAIKFSPERGQVEVSFFTIERFVRVEVRDNGPGISAQDLARLFKPFTQVGEPLANGNLGGTGLGLAVAQQLAILMGGRVGATSEIGHGSCFWVELPVDHPAEVDRDAQAAGSSTSPLALIVDNDSDARELIELALRAEGFRTFSVRSGEEGLAAARAQRPDVITLDIYLPGMDGWEVLRAMAADPVLENIPVVVVTISSDQARSFALGAHGHLIKPISRAALANVLPRRAREALPQA
jgi:signal transduction histidine kinase/CHASE3 domain sensor protein/ActR/RegA family two-component response regulator